MRISEWAQSFGVWVEPAESKPGETVYRVRDIFTTRDGSWEPSDKPGSVPQWARNEYLKRLDHPQYNDDGGADRHLFGAVAADIGLRPFGTIRYWTYTDDANHTNQRVKLHGWANVPMFASSGFVPERGERGPWAWKPLMPNADTVKGGGLPNKWHVSIFAVWKAVTIPVIIPPVEPTEPPIIDDSTLDQRVNALEKQVRRLYELAASQAALLDQWTGGK